ncbi:MAG: MBL fold metallo-hydrolase [Clostridia bacterium]|nr:MBL fold metallo-hydrolase [Clostridia bacterium]
MTITWLGHACFMLELNDGRKIVTDPFDASVGYNTPRLDCDIVTISHGHHDHNAVEELSSFKTSLSEVGVYEFENLKISAISSFHDEFGGAKRGSNLIFKFEADGKTIVHLGDLGHTTNDEQTSFIKNADVLLIPIGGTYTINADEAIQIIDRAKPVCAVPMHFLTPAISFPIEDEKAFQKKTNAVYLRSNCANADNLKGAVIFDY